MSNYKEKLKDTIDFCENELTKTSDKVNYLLNEINGINNTFGLQMKNIKSANKDIKLMVGECIKIEYLVSRFDLDPEIRVNSTSNIIEVLNNKIIKAKNAGNTTLLINDINNSLITTLNIEVFESNICLYEDSFLYNADTISAIQNSTLPDNSGNGNDFVLAGSFQYLAKNEDGSVKLQSATLISDIQITGSFSISFVINDTDSNYAARFRVYSGETQVINIGQYVDRNPYIKFVNFDTYGDMSNQEFFDFGNKVELTYVFNYETHYTTVYKNGVKICDRYCEYLSLDYLTEPTKVHIYGHGQDLYNYRIYNRLLNDNEVRNIFLSGKTYNDLVHSKAIECSDMIIEEGIIYSIDYNVMPDNCYNKEIIIESDNEDIVRVYNGKIYGIKEGNCKLSIYTKDDGILKIINIKCNKNVKNKIDGFVTLPLTSNMKFYNYNKNQDSTTYAFETNLMFSGANLKRYDINDITDIYSDDFPTVLDTEKPTYIGECIAGASDNDIIYFTIKILKEKLNSNDITTLGLVGAFNKYIDEHNINISFRAKNNLTTRILDETSKIELINTSMVSKDFVCCKITCDDLAYVYNVTDCSLKCDRFIYNDNIDNNNDNINISYTHDNYNNYINLKLHKCCLKTYDVEGIKEFLSKHPLEIYAHTSCEEPVTLNLSIDNNNISIGDIVHINSSLTDINGNEISLNEVIYASSDETIATVANGVLFAKSPGNVIIYGRSAYRNIKDEIRITITGEITENNNVEYMKTLNLQVGDEYTTLGYNINGDNGGATYDIMTYDEWYNSLPEDCKYIKPSNSFIKTPVNECGDHTLNNGLIAKLRRTGLTTPEQWGCIGDGITNNVNQMVHMFALIKSGIISFKNDALYMCYRTVTINPYMRYMVGNMNGGSTYSRPIIANIDGLTIKGNNATIKNADDGFDLSGSAVLNFSGVIKDLDIDGLNIDGNCYTMKTCVNTNHAIFYAISTMYGEPAGDHPYFKDPANDPYVVLFETDENTGKVGHINRGAIQNWTIQNCTFKNTGTMYNDLDCGYGDDILIINPYNFDTMTIINNHFLNWGRWVLAIDLGGAGERLYNLTFDNNICIQQDEASRIPHKRQRGLGWIDFESKKCFTNLSVCNNVVEGVNGFALNGNSKVSNHIRFCNNHIVKPIRPYSHAYMYMHEWYSCQIDDLLVENNYIDGNSGSSKFGYTQSNITIRNNQLLQLCRFIQVRGDITIEDNNFEFMRPFRIESFSEELYNCDSITVTYRNNNCGLESTYSNNKVKWVIENNKLPYLNISCLNGNDRPYIDLSQLNMSNVYSIRGFRPIGLKSINRAIIPGGSYFEAGETMIEDCSNVYFFGFDWFGRNENNGNLNLTSYNSVNDFCSKTGKKKIVCTKTGYFPCTGGFNCCEQDIELIQGTKVSANCYVYDTEYVYIVKTAGTLGSSVTENNGLHTSGTASLIRCLPLGKFTIE